MNICIIGDGLTSLSFAKNLINKKINVHIYERKKKFLSIVFKKYFLAIKVLVRQFIIKSYLFSLNSFS